ncbi:MAG TPA: MCE family protein [Dietzia timorensis]|uniref:MCE family protein n=1 Tax=Dietzia timorensis TaxID=499555 RepID=A0A921JY31_9ACTN|nr:MCE family protein [Dietzia timorensis]HJE90769.1 MCE family protein [Dietzia timorensis]
MTRMSATARRLLAVLFVIIVAAFIGGSIAMYNKAFTSVSEIDLYTDDVGYALPKHADVKVRGVNIGRVTEVEPDGDRVRVQLAIDPDYTEKLPADVTARLIPKTLFGERFVDIYIPDGGGSGKLADVDSIAQDERGNAVELDRVLDGLLPVLEAVPPHELAATLGALSQALQGNGDRLGVSFEQLGKVFGGINEDLPALESGLQDLATFSQTYTEAVPDLIGALDALRTTSHTVVEKQDALRGSIQSVTTASNDLAGFIDVNKQSVIDVLADSRQTLDYLAQYSPVLECSVLNFQKSLVNSDDILGVGDEHPGIRVTVEVVNPRGRYLPNQDEPRAFDTRGARCYGTPGPGENFPAAPGGALADGAYQPPTRNPGPAVIPDAPDPRSSDAPITQPRQRGSVPDAPGRYVPEQPNRPLPPGVDDRPMGYENSPIEVATVQTIYGAAKGEAPESTPGWVAGLGAPALRGAEVTIR